MVGMVVALVASVALGGGVLRWRRRPVYLGALALVVLGTLSWVPMLAPAIAWLATSGGLPEPWAADAPVTPWRAFGSLLIAELVVALATGIVVAAASAVALSRRAPAGGWVALLPAWVGLVAGWTVSLTGVAHATWILSLGELPELSLGGRQVVHVGRERTVQTVVGGGWSPERWVVQDPVSLVPGQPGQYTVTLTAVQELVSIRTQATLEAGLERSDPVFPLRVGNRWTWERTRSGRDHFLFGIISSRYENTEPAGTLEVVGAVERDGLRLFTCTWDTPEAHPSTFEVYAMDGQVWLADPAADDQLLIRHHPAATDRADACTFELHPDYDCECRAPTTSRLEIPGPTWCTWTGRTPGGRIASGIVAVITAGTFVPGASERVTLDLVESVAGPDGAEQIPPP